MTQKSDVHVGILEASRGGQLPDFAGNTAQQLDTLAFGGVLNTVPAQLGRGIKAQSEILAPLAPQGIEKRQSAAIRIVHAGFIGHQLPYRPKVAEARKES